MKFNTITYERSVKLYNEGGKSAKVELIVEPEDDPREVMELAAAFVDSQLGLRADDLQKKIERLNNEKYQAESDLRTVTHNLAIAKDNWEKAKAFLSKHGVSIDSEIPF